MEKNHGQEIRNKLKLTNKSINKYHQLFIEQGDNTFSSNIENLKEKFEKKYKLYVNIERFAIPVIGRISAGKSTFLSYLLGLRDIKGEEEISTTQIVCIIRHNRDCENPKAYPVKFIERKIEDFENKNKMKKYNFEKDNSIELNNDNISIKNIINDTDDIQKFFKKTILPIIYPNILFSFFIFDSSKFYVNDTFDIYDNFLKKLNGIDDKIKFEDYYDKIELGKENNFYILNKIDIEHKKTIKQDLIDKFKIDEKKNFIQETNSKLLINETEKDRNFNSYLEFKINNVEKKDFTRYIQREMKKDFNLTSIDLNKEIKIDENEENKFINFLKEKEVILKSKNFTNLLNINNYLNLREKYNTYKKNLNLNKENFFITNY